MRIILASKSPRRREYCKGMFRDFEILTADADETLPEGTEPEEGVRLLAVKKGEAVASLVSDPEALILSADTLVDLDGKALGKPKDANDAKRMLRALSGKTHFVHTGVAVRYHGGTFSSTATTAVTFRELSEEEIDDYVASGDPMDKAGSYGIQAGARRFVSEIDGDFDTVVGLSRNLVRDLISFAAPDLEVRVPTDDTPDFIPQKRREV